MTEEHDVCRVLVVDDSEEMRAVVRRVLAADGYHIDDAATVAQARALNPYTYQAILVDMRLGLGQGSDFVREMVAAASDMAGRCLVITGGSADAVPHGIPYLTKPFEPEQLRAAVRALINTGPAVGRPRVSVPPPPAGGSAREKATEAGQEQGLFALVRLIRMRERRDLADRLHDGPLQELSSAALELHLMHTRQTAGRTHPLESAIRLLDQAALAVRSLTQEQEERGLPREETRLASAVRDQTAWLLASPATVEIDPPPAEVPADQVSLIADVAEFMLFLLAGDSPLPSAQLSIQVTRDAIRIDAAVTMPGGSGSGIAQRQPAGPAGADTRLRDLATALSATVQVTRDLDRAQARLTFPRRR